MKKYFIWFFVILAGIVLCVIAYKETIARQAHTTFLNDYRFLIMVAGEGFEHLCNPQITVTFDDAGNIEIVFDAEQENEIVWIFLSNKDGFAWETSGSVENVTLDNDGYYITGIQTSEDSNIEIFRIQVAEDESIKVQLKQPKLQTRYLVSLRTPIICALTNNLSYSVTRFNSLIDYLENAEMTEDEVAELGKDVTNRLLSVGNIGDVVLSPALPKINIYYNDSELYIHRYDLRAKPDGYTQEYGMLAWNGFQQLYPIIEYRDERAIKLSERVTGILYIIGSFLITTGIIEWIMYAHSSGKKKKYFFFLKGCAGTREK